MLRLAASITICCFLTVSILGTGFGLLCIPICQAEEIVEVEIPEPSSCGSCCPSEPVTFVTACAQAPPEAKLIYRDLCCPEDPPAREKCCKCVNPHLISILAESRTPAPDIFAGDVPDFAFEINETNQYLTIDDSRPQGVHPFISITVLRC